MAIGTTRKARIDELAERAGQVGNGKPEDTGVSLAASAWRRLRRNPVFLLGAIIILVFIVVAVLSPLLAPHNPSERLLVDQVVKARNQIPSPQPGYPFGGDEQGRDLLSRLLVGSQQTLLVGVLATTIGLAGGLVMGTLAGALAGWIDSVVMRAVDVMLSVPGILLAVTIAALFAHPSVYTVIIAVSMIQVPVFARLLRGSMLAQRASDHVLAARALGVKPRAIVFRHMLPNALGPVIVQSTLVLALAIIDAAALSFLGLGNPDDKKPEWGQMLGNSQALIDSHPHLAFLPAACIITVALGFTLVGESMRDALDPKNRR
jgi:peptide/nickel transport system permease protein